MRLEDFGITPEWVTGKLAVYSICLILSCAAGILLWCLFCIGLSRIAKKRGEEKEWYAYLPLLRLYTLGKMSIGSEKNRKIFACLLPSLAVVRFVMTVVFSALFLRTAAALIFAAENISGGSFTVEQLITFPLSYLIVAFIITAVLTLAYKLVYAYCYYGAVKGSKWAIPFTVLSFLSCVLSCVFLYVASREKEAEAGKPDKAD